METVLKSLPQRAENILQLAHQIVAKHLLEGVNSPIKITHIAEINMKACAAQRKHEEGMKFLKFAQELFQERDHLLGLHQDQFATQNIMYHLQSIQEALLQTHHGHEEKLEEWGFTHE